MERLTAKEIASAIGGKIIKGKGEAAAVDVCMDSREAKAGDLFVALKGTRTDGHLFIKDAEDKGCNLMLVSEKDVDVLEGTTLIQVKDTLKGLQDLSSWYLKKMGMRIIAVTGSVGKTSTRDLTYAAVSSVYQAGSAKRNYNSETGLPLTLLSFKQNMEVGVVEMGMDRLGEIHKLASIAKPEVAIITNIGYSHIESLGSRENIRKAKMEITDYLAEGNTLIINDDDDMLMEIDEKKVPYKVVRVGTSKNAEYRVGNITDMGTSGISFLLENQGRGYHVELGLPGAHNGLNAALAIAAANAMGVSTEDAIRGIGNASLTGSRLNLLDARGITIIDDSYNAAPASMLSALETLMHTDALRHIAILGNMEELGEMSVASHRSIGEEAVKKGVDILVTIGDKAEDIAKGAMEMLEETKGKTEVKSFPNRKDSYEYIEEILKAGDAVLVKASRSAAMEKVVEIIKESREGQKE